MPVTLPVCNPLRLAALLLAAFARRRAVASSRWCPPPLEPDDHLLRDIGKTRAELLGYCRYDARAEQRREE